MSLRSRLSRDDSQSGSEYEDSDSLQSYEEDHVSVVSSSGVSTSSGEHDHALADDSAPEVTSLQYVDVPEILATGPRYSHRELNARNRTRRLKGWYYPKYRHLFNSLMKDLTTVDEDDVTNFDDSTIGVSHWTAEEKVLLFSALGSTGPGDAQALSEAIGSKTVPEVQDYLDLLQQGSIEDYLTSEAYPLPLGQDEIPAAIEVGADREIALDQAAEKLAHKVELQDQEREKARHSDYWLLTPTKAAEIENMYAAPADEDIDSVEPAPPPHPRLSNPVPAADLLHLPNWLELASLFMSSSADHQISWVDLIESNDERPSIYNTAFSDFHSLTVALTQRLVNASLFQALSRLRATSHSSPDLVVHHSDVQAAAKILGYTTGWTQYWIHAPRRIGLSVYSRGKAAGLRRDIPSQHRSVLLDYDQVETSLRSGRAEFERLASSSFASPSPQVILPSIEDDEPYDPPAESDSDFYTDASTSQPSPSPEPQYPSQEDIKPSTPRRRASSASDSEAPPPLTPSARLRMETTYLDALDARASHHEEARLWTAISRGQPRKEGERKHPRDEEDEPLPPAPPRLRRRERVAKVEEEVRGWRERVTWVPEWTSRPGEDKFEEVGRRGERRRAARLQWRGMGGSVREDVALEEAAEELMDEEVTDEEDAEEQEESDDSSTEEQSSG